MDRNTITGIVLIFAIFLGFSVYNNSRANKSHDAYVKVADSLYNTGNLESARTEFEKALALKPADTSSIRKVNEINNKLGYIPALKVTDTTNVRPVSTDNNVASTTSPVATVNTSQYGAFANAANGENDFITLENSKVELKISMKGGRVYSARLKEYTAYDSLPVVLFSGDSTIFGFKFFTSDNKAIQTNDLYFTPVSDQKTFSAETGPASVKLRLIAEGDKYIEYTYTLQPDNYMVNFDVKFNSLESIIAANMNSLTFDWKMYIPQQEQGRQNEENYSDIRYKYYQDDVTNLKQRQTKELEKVDIPTKLSWIAFQDQFFSSVIISNDFFLNGSISSTRTLASKKYTRYYTSEIGIPYNPASSNTIGLKLYYGPNSFPILKKYNLDLEQLVILGKNITRWINQFVIIPIFNWLHRSIANFGIIILILTLIIKAVLFPLTFKSYQSQVKMKVLKPLVDDINKRYPKKEDAMKKQQATMNMYKRAGVSPMGGCLPMLLQMPILFAMFRFFPTSIELRHQAFLWAKDLSAYDSILNLPFTIPMYGAHVSLFTLLMTASTLITMKYNSPSSGQDQMPGMKTMMYIMPIMFMLIMNNLPSALTYYYFLVNMITFAQNLISKGFIDEVAVLAKLDENKNKPIKKSKFQLRLEEAAKQRGINPPKR
jgi:YidC/Oxa1 family membrane protein insertase